MATITWSIVDLEREVADGYVHLVNYRVDGTEAGFFAAFTSKTFLVRPNENFVPYEDLTEAIVLGWIHTEIGPEAVEAIERGIEAELHEQQFPTVAHGLPWIN